MSGKVVDGRPRELLVKEIEELRARLAEAEQALVAIRSGDIDALLIQTPEGEQVYSLAGVERVYRTIVETMNEAALTVSPEGVILFCNQRFAEMVNLALQEVVGLSLADMIEPSHRMLLSELIRQAQSGPSRCRLLLNHLAAAPRPTQFSASLLVTEGGRSICLVVTDLSQIESAEELIQLLGDQKKELERSKQAMQESEQRFRLALKNSPVLVAMQDSNLVYQWAYNTRTRQPEDVIGKTDADLFPPEDMPSILEAKRRVLQTGEVARIELWLTSNGQRVFLDCYCEPVRDPAGKIIGIGIAAVNLTEQKRAEEALRESEERYRTLFDSMTEGFALHEIVTDEQGRPVDYRFLDVNPAFELLTGLKRADLLGKRVLEVLPGIEAHWIDSYGRVALTGEPVHFENYSANMNQWFDVYAYRSAPRQFAVVFTDISEQKKAEEKMRESEARLRAVLDGSPDPVFLKDRYSRLLLANPATFALIGKPAEACLGKTDEQFYDNPADGRAIMANDCRIMASGQTETVEETVGTPFGPRYYLSNKAPYRDAAGNVIGLIGVARDITVRKQAEEGLRQLNENLEQRVAERTSELAHTVKTLQGEIKQRERAEYELKLANEQLAGRANQLRALAGELTMAEQAERKRLSKILHDGLQQHLASAKLQLGGLSDGLADDDLKQAKEIDKTIAESMHMSRSLSVDLSPPILYDGGLSSGLEWLARWMRDKYNLNVELSIEDKPQLPEDVKIFLFESVRELLFNTVKHAQVSRARVSMRQMDGAGLQIIVSDEGAGFDPCQLKLPGENGGGFGLFSIRERIGLIGGSVQIDSAPGKGSRLALMVPHGPAPAVVPLSADRMGALAAEPQEDTVKDQGTTIRVLLADDHALFRNGIGRLLRNEPCLEVVGQAADGKEAIELAQKLKPDVILMDVSMPRVNGIEATRIIHGQYPDIRIIGLSMYEDPERAQAMRDAGAADYKTKGCAAAELVAAIRACPQERESSLAQKPHGDEKG